jgi:hypothetical protein
MTRVSLGPPRPRLEPDEVHREPLHRVRHLRAAQAAARHLPGGHGGDLERRGGLARAQERAHVDGVADVKRREKVQPLEILSAAHRDDVGVLERGRPAVRR